MKNITSIVLTGSFIPFLLLGTAVRLFGETVHLKDGSVITGTIKPIDDHYIECETKNGALRINKEDILKTESTEQAPPEAAKIVTPGESDTHLPHWGISATYIGGGVRYNFSDRWAGELRYLTGSDSGAGGEVRSKVYGFRVYNFRHLNAGAHSLYIGVEAASIQGDQNNTPYSASGIAIGGFVGVKFRVSQWVSLEADIGPYLFSLSEKQSKVKESSLDFVANSSLVFRIF